MAGSQASGKAFPVTGTYLNKMTPIINIELKEDGTFCQKFGNRAAYGKYTVDGDRVIFTPETGKPFEFTIKENTLQSKEGARFIKL